MCFNQRLNAINPFFEVFAPFARTLRYKRKIACRNLPQLFFADCCTDKAVAFVFGQTAVNVFCNVLADISRKSFAIGFDWQQFGTPETLLFHVFPKDLP